MTGQVDIAADLDAVPEMPQVLVTAWGKNVKSERTHVRCYRIKGVEQFIEYLSGLTSAATGTGGRIHHHVRLALKPAFIKIRS